MRKQLALGALAVSLAACQPATTSPAHVVAMIQTSTGVYAPQQVNLSTLQDVVAVSGAVATFSGGARIVDDPSDPLWSTNGGNLTDSQVAQILLKSKGIPPRASYIQQGDVLWPADFNTWNMISAYYAFEKAFVYWQGVGVAAEEIEGAQVYYFPTYIETAVSPNALVDNALFYSPVQGFLLLPFDANYTLVPLEMNLGVLGHEYSHRVWNKHVYDGESLPAPLGQWSGTPEALNILKSFDEGLADWNGYGVTCGAPFGCDTRFLQASLGEDEATARDMSLNTQCMTDGLLNALQTEDNDTFDGASQQYLVGTIIAASLYHSAIKTSGEAGLQVLQQAVLDAYNDTDPNNPGFEQIIQNNLQSPALVPEMFIDAILGHISDLTVQQQTCDEFIDRFGANPELMPNCPATSGPGNTTATCPAL